MKRPTWRFNLALLLVLTSGIGYLVHYLIFHDKYYLFYYPIMDIAFLPIQVLLVTLPDSDLDHLSGDIRRAYGLILIEWVAYMRHLHSDYPYLFSLALRTSPFDPRADAVVGSA